MKRRLLSVAMAGGLLAAALAAPVQAGDVSGNFMVRVLGTVVSPAEDVNSVKLNGAAILGADADVSTQVIPAATLSYFLNRNLAVELFCCFTKHSIDGKGSLAGLGKIADSWLFPPTLTLQYHFDKMGPLKPYVGAGATWIHFFSEGKGRNALAATDVEIDDAFGFALQAGLDYSLGSGWYLNADVKKIFINTDVTWKLAGGNRVVADVDLDPWIFSLGVGYRFNLEDVFGGR